MRRQLGSQRRRIGRGHQPVPECSGVGCERRHEVAHYRKQLRMQIYQLSRDLLMQDG
jgi:hypothetical protein